MCEESEMFCLRIFMCLILYTNHGYKMRNPKLTSQQMTMNKSFIATLSKTCLAIINKLSSIISIH